MASSKPTQVKANAALIILPKLDDLLPVHELRRGQEETAMWLEVSYLSLHDFPEVEDELRQNSVSCRQQQHLSINLVEKFNLTARQIVEDTIPQIRDAVEMQDAELAENTITMAVRWITDVKEDAKVTQKRYQELILNMNKNISTAKRMNETVCAEKRRLDCEAETTEKFLQVLGKKKENIVKKLEDVEKEMNLQKEKVEKLKKQSWFWKLFRGENLPEATEEMRKKSDEYWMTLNEGSAAENELIEKQKLLESFKYSRETMGDEGALQNVVKYLAHVDKQLQKCIDFWNKMEDALCLILRKTEKGNPYLKKLENETYQNKYLENLDVAESYWKMFSKVCTMYVDHSKRNALYDFLDGRVDSMSSTERQKAIEELANKLEYSLAITEK